MSMGFALLAAVLLAVHVMTIALVLWRYRRLGDPAVSTGVGWPKVTLLRPVCGVDPFDEMTLRSSFAQDYPEYDILFCAQDAGDPAVALVQRLIAEAPEANARLLIGDLPPLRNPKLRNVWKGWHTARTDWICMTDSNLLLPPDYLKTLIACWRPDTGLVSSPPWGAMPEGWAGRLECAFLNGNQARWQLAAASLGQGFAQGKTLVFHRPLINAAGGLAALDGHLAEDVAATHLVRRLGKRVTLAPHPFAQPIGRRGLGQVWDRQLRWAQVRREGFPGLYLAEPLNGALMPSAALLAASGANGWSLIGPAAFAAVWYGLEWAMMRRAGWPAGWRDALCLPLRDALIVPIWGTALVRRTVKWRGTTVTDRPFTGPSLAAE